MELASLEKHGYYVAVQALNAIDAAGANVIPYLDQLSRLPREHASVHERMKGHVPALIDRIVQRWPPKTV